MEEKGYLLLVLHTHLPFVRNSNIEYSIEESWLFENITECYIPLIEVFNGLIQDGIDFKITLSLTPCLIEMFNDSLLQKRYLRYIEERIQLAEEEIKRIQTHNGFLRLATIYREKFKRCKKLFTDNLDGNLISAFKYLKNSGKLEIITSGATHAYFPLWELYPQVNDLQIQLGFQQYQDIFKNNPTGFWLPECGYYPHADKLLQKYGIKYFFLEKHAVLNGVPRPKFGEHAPVHCPSGAAVFVTDQEIRDISWGRYPQNPFYLSHRKDICFERELEYLFPFTHQDNCARTGIKYSCNEPAFSKEVYDPDIAFKKCDEQANHFIDVCQREIERLYKQIGKRSIIVSTYDTEVFGHWWHEGPIWLDLVIRKLAYDQKTIKLIPAIDYLRMYPTNQVVTPTMSSWGWQGYSETWLMGRNHWIYPPLYEAIESLEEMIKTNSMFKTEYKLAINQYIRELLLAQSSDWAFMMWANEIWGQESQRYAERRVEEHIENMKNIYQQIKRNHIDIEWLDSLQSKNNIFSNKDLCEIYKNILYSHRSI